MGNWMVVIVLLIIINLLVTWARLQKRKWLRYLLITIAVILVFPALIMGLKVIS
ncbi:hypothetical protein [Thermoflavimicrobium dichotomicum]|uniref:Uncharacterized protein n=1 Tax=Thermoflavimicrobium dichotomicum TaxID=46223 RepID=A0A1I3SJ83_9BACL|nr:hypothetical protein [Thermoflavimicrobium dichotomicum]SFJ57711.1 hypothetical protein SAMN05421852_11323 [Thermoflavimicrobium dichotomicum]